MEKKDAKQQIIDAFRKLMDEQAFDEITVSAIIKAAGVSRATFYRNFRDKYDVMNLIFSDKFRNMFLNNPEIDDYKHFLLQYCRFLLQNKNYFIHAAEVEGQNSFLEVLFDMGMNYYCEQIRKALGVKQLSDETLFSVRLFTSGTVYMTKEWLNNGLEESPEKLSTMVYNSMPPVMCQCFSTDMPLQKDVS